MSLFADKSVNGPQISVTKSSRCAQFTVNSEKSVRKWQKILQFQPVRDWICDYQNTISLSVAHSHMDRE